MKPKFKVWQSVLKVHTFRTASMMVILMAVVIIITAAHLTRVLTIILLLKCISGVISPYPYKAFWRQVLFFSLFYFSEKLRHKKGLITYTWSQVSKC